MPINTLKIDKSFIHSINQNAQGESLTSMIIMLGKELGLTVVAEGVETKEQVEYLESLNVIWFKDITTANQFLEKVLNLLNKNNLIKNDSIRKNTMKGTVIARIRNFSRN